MQFNVAQSWPSLVLRYLEAVHPLSYKLTMQPYNINDVQEAGTMRERHRHTQCDC